MRGATLLTRCLFDVRDDAATVLGAHGIDNAQRPRQHELQEGKQECQESKTPERENHGD